jgi:hypothetical protein
MARSGCAPAGGRHQRGLPILATFRTRGGENRRGVGSEREPTGPDSDRDCAALSPSAERIEQRLSAPDQAPRVRSTRSDTSGGPAIHWILVKRLRNRRHAAGPIETLCAVRLT